MKAVQYIREKISAYGMSISEADLLDVKLKAGIDEDDELTQDNSTAVAYGLVWLIPQLLARPKSISEGGVSVSWDTAGLRDFYSLLCKNYGFDDELNDKPKVTFQ